MCNRAVITCTQTYTINRKGQSFNHIREGLEKNGIKITGIKQTNKYKKVKEWREWRQKKLNVTKLHTLFIFNETITYQWLRSEISTTVINPLMNRTWVGIEPGLL